ncbi:MAG: LytR/AlgR family response regulator transcription factor [Saprospiraceae bacterium]
MDNEFIFVKVGTLINKIQLADICAIESEGNYCTIKTSKQAYIQRSSLTKMKGKLEGQGFIQINKSTLLPVNGIDQIDLAINEINIAGHTYKLSRSFRKEFIETLNLL